MNEIKKIQLLDCTLRDGGLALEDSYKNGNETIYFDKKQISDVILDLKGSGVDIIEVGSIEKSKEDKSRFGIYQSIEEVSVLAKKAMKDDNLVVALFRGPDTPIDDIPEWNKELVEGIRVIIRYSEMKKSMEFCKALADKGYKVFVQPMLTMRYSDDELNYIIDETNKMNAYACYFVDSYGYMQEDDVKRLFEFYNNKLDEKIKVGFHAHNNMNLAFSNVKLFESLSLSRDIIIDSCIMGMGQGAGNLQTEIITYYLNKKYNFSYDVYPILDACEIIEKFYGKTQWGYSVERFLSAINKGAYKVACSLRDEYHFSYSDIQRIFDIMPSTLKNRYTPEMTERIVNEFRNSYEK